MNELWKKTVLCCMAATGMVFLCSAGVVSGSGELTEAKGIWLEAEGFAEKGGWVVDQQFMDQMGSPYLLAHGIGTPVENASTTVDIPEAGAWHVYVRTFNWTSPWTSEPGPGKFRVGLGGKVLKTDLGASGSAWEWQYAGQASLKAGLTSVSLIDRTGFDGRCDAVYITMDINDIPPTEGPDLAAFRRRAMGLPEADETGYDFVVVGGGIAGICAAATAARLGCTVALVNDRPVLGGNNSSEIRVGMGGYSEFGLYEGLGRIIREFGHTRDGNANPPEYYEDQKKLDFIASEPDITLWLNCHAVDVRMDGDRIAAVLVRDIETSEEHWLAATLFSDCTGDGTLGYLAGADYRMGRESREEYGESMAPEDPDEITLGTSVQWYSEDREKRTSFPEFSYGVEFNEENCEAVTSGRHLWETGMNLDTVEDAERIRDYMLLIIYSNWSYLKNHKEDNAEWQKKDLAWVAYVAGKRESRRLLGDYVLKQDDIDKGVFHEDASFTATYSIELHYPEERNSELFPGEEFKGRAEYTRIYPYAVPYRCLYSRNVANLFMAGRDISVTHVALGTVRVMRTGGMMGEVVGMAASLCMKHGCLPRQVYWYHLDELKPLMKEGVGKYEGDVSEQRFNVGSAFLPRPRALSE